MHPLQRTAPLNSNRESCPASLPPASSPSAPPPCAAPPPRSPPRCALDSIHSSPTAIRLFFFVSEVEQRKPGRGGPDARSDASSRVGSRVHATRSAASGVEARVPRCDAVRVSSRDASPARSRRSNRHRGPRFTTLRTNQSVTGPTRGDARAVRPGRCVGPLRAMRPRRCPRGPNRRSHPRSEPTRPARARPDLAPTSVTTIPPLSQTPTKSAKQRTKF